MTTKKLILIVSVLFNILFIVGYLWNYLNSPTYHLGVLTKDVKVRAGLSGNNGTILFNLPKGLAVRNVSQTGLAAIGQFENNRFEIVITSDDQLIDYKESGNKHFPFGNFYSADTK
ncbi:MAG: hypothetical protein EOP47_22115 [Sphingobacteriaceae bacterium]|nr:MAG: hypothetical protein EOP47_22115 [Sphingobacteriaceae bacterium]